MAAVTEARTARKLSTDRVFDEICRYALEYNGITPTTRQIGEALDISHQRVSYLMLILERQNRIEWIGRYSYRVVNSTWEPPPVENINF
jgi:hypothetical protein